VAHGSGFEHRTLEGLLREWREMDAVVRVLAAEARFRAWARASALSLLAPSRMRRNENRVISLLNPTHWMARQAEDAGVEICAW
jgi:flavin-dependent dehydrogenase